MKKLILASALTLLCAGSALASDSFSFGITLGVPIAPAYVGWDRSYPVVRDYRPIVVRDHDYYGRHHRPHVNRECRTVREEVIDHGRVVTARTMTVCDTRHDGWRVRDHGRDDRRHDGRHHRY
jgi:hypothetical protein